jgi:predicted transglutaminase-like cysteine proteinase
MAFGSALTDAEVAQLYAQGNVTPANVAPTVSITAPAANAAFAAGSMITLTAAAADSDGTVARVEFLDGAAIVGTATAAPWSVNWTGAAAGTHTLIARATDNAGAATASAPVTISVAAATNAPPANAAACASENQSCTPPQGATVTVWYGANGSWVSKTGVTGSIACNNATFGDPIPGTGKACRYVVTAPGNVAPYATPATSFVSTWESLAAVNNNIVPVNSADKTGGAYGNWNGTAAYGATNWVSFTWGAAKTVSAFEVYWWNDGGGIATPTAATVDYWNGSAWVAIGPVGLSLNTFNRISFAPVSTTRIRVSMKSTRATGILEARVTGY